MKFILSIILLFALGFNSKASHIIGGDIYYDYLGNDNYKFYVTIYRDCNSTGAQFDDPLPLGVFNSSNELVRSVEIPFPGSTVLPVVFNNPCVTPPSNICNERAIYTTVINLPPVIGGYTVAYQRCCRGPNINNLNNPANQGLTLSCIVPGVNTGFNINSSPRFNDYPPLLLCNNDELIFDHSATDPDGDLLEYSFVTPYQGASSFTPAPNPIPAPPYPLVQWGAGITATTALGPGATININPNTGLLTASPNLLGRFVVGIRVKEIRNGVIINSTVRDFIFQVFNCQLALEAVLPTQEELPGFTSYCNGLTVNFDNQSYGGSNYEWDFGDPTTNTDVSNQYEPSYTYPDEGIYYAELVVNPGWPCTDTAIIELKLFNPISVEISSEDTMCFEDNSFDFEAEAIGPADMELNWEFGSDADPPNGTGMNVNNVHFNAPGIQTVNLIGITEYCETSHSKNVFTIDSPIAEMIVPEQEECLGYTLFFGNNSTNATSYHWDYGVPSLSSDTSNVSEGPYTYTNPGNYTVSLIAMIGNNCADTITEDITIQEPVTVSFTSQDSMCVTDNSFDFDATVTGPSGTSFLWNFGPSATPNSSTNIDVNGVHFNQTGSQIVTLTGTHGLCTDQDAKQIYLYREPTIGFSIINDLQCVPFEAQFTNTSTAETGISYFWNFGDGSTSNEESPSHIYESAGNFPVTLTISTNSGCVNTLNLTQADLINIHPNPVAAFTTSTDQTDICHSEIMFIDQSIGAVKYRYYFDDSTFTSNEENPTYTYLTDGTHYPSLYVENIWGCTDTTFRDVYIEGYTVYAPNTFTPDEDQYNSTFLPVAYLGNESWNMKIYNRWGELVYESIDETDFWDGTDLNGYQVQDGTYIYKLELETCEPINNERTVVGHINLIR